MDVRLPDGTVISGVPDNITKAELTEKLSRNGYDVSKLTPQAQPEESFVDKVKGFYKTGLNAEKNLLGGGLRGAGSVGSTLMALSDAFSPATAYKLFNGETRAADQERRASMDSAMGELGFDPGSLPFKGGKLGGEIAGTAGAGSVAANTVRSMAPVVSQSPRIAQFLTALESGGLRTGAAPGTLGAKATDLAIRSSAGAANGAAQAGLANPDDTLSGATIGALLPPSLAFLGRIGSYAGKVGSSIVQPFTSEGQKAIAANAIRKFGEGGPMSINASEIVPGSTPTLAEATGNPGIATLQRATRDMRPNAFVEREAKNAAARNAAFDAVAGDADKMAFFKADRKTAAKQLYDDALDPANQNELTPWLKGQVTQLMKSPTITEARKEAQRLARDRLEKPSAAGSMRALQDVRDVLGDRIGEAVNKGKGGEAEALGNLQDKLTTVMEHLSDSYKTANKTYAEMSKPINQMEALQGLSLRDQQGNITLAKVQNALRTIQKKIDAPGINSAKSIDPDQIKALTAIRDDLLRQSNLSLGKSIGSNTFQNIATDNILQQFGAGALGNKFGGLLGQFGQLAYNKPNEAIRGLLVDMSLNPRLAEEALSAQSRAGLLGVPGLHQSLLRASPLLANDQ